MNHACGQIDMRALFECESVVVRVMVMSFHKNELSLSVCLYLAACLAEWLPVCMYVCMYVRMCVQMYILCFCMFIIVYICLYVLIDKHLCIHYACMHINL